MVIEKNGSAFVTVHTDGFLWHTKMITENLCSRGFRKGYFYILSPRNLDESKRYRRDAMMVLYHTNSRWRVSSAFDRHPAESLPDMSVEQPLCHAEYQFGPLQDIVIIRVNKIVLVWAL